MRLDKNVIDAVKKAGHDRIVIHDTGVYSCKVDPETRMGDKATVMHGAAIVYGAKNIILIGDTFITAPYVAFDLREKATKEQVKEVANE
jgi:hypothetical protein